MARRKFPRSPALRKILRDIRTRRKQNTKAHLMRNRVPVEAEHNDAEAAAAWGSRSMMFLARRHAQAWSACVARGEEWNPQLMFMPQPRRQTGSENTSAMCHRDPLRDRVDRTRRRLVSSWFHPSAPGPVAFLSRAGQQWSHDDAFVP